MDKPNFDPQAFNSQLDSNSAELTSALKKLINYQSIKDIVLESTDERQFDYWDTINVFREVLEELTSGAVDAYYIHDRLNKLTYSSNPLVELEDSIEVLFQKDREYTFDDLHADYKLHHNMHLLLHSLLDALCNDDKPDLTLENLKIVKKGPLVLQQGLENFKTVFNIMKTSIVRHGDVMHPFPEEVSKTQDFIHDLEIFEMFYEPINNIMACLTKQFPA